MKLIFTFFIFSFFCYSQNKVINIDYKFKLKNHLYFDFEYNANIKYNDSLCLFEWGDKNEPERTKYDNEGYPITFSKTDSLGSFNFFYKNKLYSRFFGITKFVIASEDKTNLVWYETNETKTILNYKCYKIQTFFRGRNYTCWYTKDLKAPISPLKLYYEGGLILEINDDTNKINIIAEKIEFNVDYDLGEFLKNHIVSNPKLKILKEYLEYKKKILQENEVEDFKDYIELKHEWDE